MSFVNEEGILRLTEEMMQAVLTKNVVYLFQHPLSHFLDYLLRSYGVGRTELLEVY